MYSSMSFGRFLSHAVGLLREGYTDGREEMYRGGAGRADCTILKRDRDQGHGQGGHR